MPTPAQDSYSSADHKRAFPAPFKCRFPAVGRWGVLKHFACQVQSHNRINRRDLIAQRKIWLASDPRCWPFCWAWTLSDALQGIWESLASTELYRGLGCGACVLHCPGAATLLFASQCFVNRPGYVSKCGPPLSVLTGARLLSSPLSPVIVTLIGSHFQVVHALEGRASR